MNKPRTDIVNDLLLGARTRLQDLPLILRFSIGSLEGATERRDRDQNKAKGHPRWPLHRMNARFVSVSG